MWRLVVCIVLLLAAWPLVCECAPPARHDNAAEDPLPDATSRQVTKLSQKAADTYEMLMLDYKRCAGKDDAISKYRSEAYERGLRHLLEFDSSKPKYPRLLTAGLSETKGRLIFQIHWLSPEFAPIAFDLMDPQGEIIASVEGNRTFHHEADLETAVAEYVFNFNRHDVWEILEDEPKARKPDDLPVVVLKKTAAAQIRQVQIRGEERGKITLLNFVGDAKLRELAQRQFDETQAADAAATAAAVTQPAATQPFTYEEMFGERRKPSK